MQVQNLLKKTGIGRLVGTNNEKKQSNNDSVCMMQDGTSHKIIMLASSNW
jgi:hypothetical protein